MTENLSIEKINALSIFQRKFRFLKNEMKHINNQVIFFKDTIMSMLNNLNNLNNIKIFENTNSSYILILEEIKKIKEMLDIFPEKLNFKNLKNKSLNYYSINLIKVNNIIIKYFNHIAPENINYILKILEGNNWISSFDENDIDKILFISRFFKPICVWHSVHHKVQTLLL